MNNEFYHNCFFANVNQTYAEPGYANTWDDGCEGNYWSNYNGTDGNEDGIGDTPFVVYEENQDNYPLMNPYWNPADINHDLSIDWDDVMLVLGFIWLCN